MDARRNPKLPAFEDIGQVEVKFLGQRIVIGSIEREEEKTPGVANKFEIDAGDVTKAVSGPIEPIQAMLMAGTIAYDLLEQVENNAIADLT